MKKKKKMKKIVCTKVKWVEVKLGMHFLLGLYHLLQDSNLVEVNY